MRVPTILLFGAVVFAIPVFSQSGRRIAPSPSPSATAEEAETYSETVPTKQRPPRISPLFRGIGLNAEREADKAADNARSETSSEEDIVRIETNLVTIPVSVFDRNGLYVAGLRKEEFTVFDNGVEQTIEYFGTTDKPFTVLLLLDTSPSTDYKIEEIRAAARAFVDQLMPHDRVAVVEFDGNVQILSPPTGSREQIYRAIKKADFGWGTALYDGVTVSLKQILGNVDGRKALVLFTDGVDTQSVKSTYDTTLDLAEEFDAPIFPIYYNTFSQNARQSSTWPFPDDSPPAPGTTAREYALGKKYLGELAEYTGGRMFQPDTDTGGLTRAFEGIAEELRRQYIIGYVPLEDGKPGQRRSIKVRIERPHLAIRSRDSYIVSK